MGAFPCCCGCCECTAEVIVGLASSYTVDLTGTWSVSGTPCGSSTTLVIISYDSQCQIDFFDNQLSTCVDGKMLELVILNIVNCEWRLQVQFYDSGGGTGGPSATYTQTVKDCNDPTGEYSNPDISGVPPTITVS